MKTSRQLERHFKGIANHRRISILFLVKRSRGITVDEISRKLRCNIKTISEHTRRLVQAGLVEKKYEGRSVRHTLTPYGKKLASLINKFSHS